MNAFDFLLRNRLPKRRSAFGAKLAILGTLILFFYHNHSSFQQLTTRHVTKPYDRGAFLIVEPREHPMLRQVVEEFSDQLPGTWTLYIVHQNSNAAFVGNATDYVSKNRSVVYVNVELNEQFKAVVERGFGSGEYNRLFKTPEFWDVIPDEEDNILVFQTDTLPCQRGSLDLQRFGEFGYIGCMYMNTVGQKAGLSFWGDYGFYGIGGLSLRRKSFTKDCLRVFPQNCPDSEDVTFSACVDILEYKYQKVPTALDVGRFCAQGGWGNATEDPDSWGVHKFNQTMPQELRSRFLNYCPKASLT